MANDEIMSEAGHIYILINPSIPGLVKVGKTTRDPESRAKELSQATGVATPFYVAFSIEVPDCHAAEDYVYAVLEHNGFNRSPNREFFAMPLRSAIEILTLVEKELRGQSRTAPQFGQTVDSASQNDPDIGSTSSHPGAAILKKASNLYYGLADEIEDREEALRLLYQAKSLNFAPAYTSLADYFARDASDRHTFKHDRLGAQESRKKALEVLKEGAQKGHGRSYVKLAWLYGGHEFGEDEPERDNVNKCWKKYFRSATFVNDDRGGPQKPDHWLR